jgi:hypothetical protein
MRLLIPSLLALLAAAVCAARADEPPILGIAELHRLDLLPRFRESLQVASISSYDRTGGNDDGFSGKYSFVRKEGDGLVIADLKGPGIIYRIWTPTPTDDPIEFFFDGEAQPRIKMRYRELFDGSKPPFVAPIVGFGSGGFYSYMPLAYKTSCKVVIRAPRVQFYQINYATYPADAKIESWTEAGFASADVEKARKLFAMQGQDVSANVAPEGAPLKTARAKKSIAGGKSAVLFEAKRGGRIAGIRISPASALAGKDRAVVLRATWDGEKRPAIDCPAGDFFGYSWGDPAARSLLVGSDGDTAYVYFPMPFDRSAKIELVNERTGGPAVEVRSEVVYADLPRRKDEGRFYATWRRENPTTKGEPFNYVKTEGRGHLVGVTLQAQGSVPGITPFFEGDDQAWIDGELTIHGTGTEDFFNGGWYDVPGRWEARASYPLSGCLDYNRPMARSGAYRLFLTDAYAFHKSLKLDQEHAPEKNDFDADYVGVSYLYMENPPTTPAPLPSVAARTVTDPPRLVFTPGWYIPIHSFSMERATLTKKNERINGRDERYISMRAEGEDVFGPHSISFLCGVPAAGRYRVFIDALTGPEQGEVRLYQNEHAVGDLVDLYAPARTRKDRIAMGELTMKEGQNQVFFKLLGKNEKSSALGFDLVTIVLERIP